MPPNNKPPTVEIVSPTNLSSHTAAYDPARKDFGAYIALSAVPGDPDGDATTVRWTSSTQGTLAAGPSATVWISTQGRDAIQPVITATVTDKWGAATSASVQIIVWIPSDT